MIRTVIAITASLTLFSCADQKEISAPTPEPKTFTVLSGENGITYPSGATTVTDDSGITIAAIPDDHFRFVKWVSSGSKILIGDSLSETTTITQLPKSGALIRAIFAPQLCTLTVVSTDSIFSRTAADTIICDYGTKKLLAASPRTGYQFVQWYSSNPDQIQCTDPKDSLAYFTVLGSGQIYCSYQKVVDTVTPETATFTMISAGNGTVFPSGEVVTTADSVTISALPAEHYRFVKWSKIGTSAQIIDSLAGTTTLTSIPSSGSVIQAIFAPQLCTLIVQPSDSAFALSHRDTIVKEYGSKLFISTVPKSGYRFDQWNSSDWNSVECSAPQETGTYLTIRGNGTVHPMFRSLKNQVTIDTAAHCSLTVKGTYSVTDSDSLAISCIPADGYRFVQWEQTGGADIRLDNRLSASTIIRGVQGDGSIQPKVEVIPYTKWTSHRFLHRADSSTNLTDLYDGGGNSLGIEPGDILTIIFQNDYHPDANQMGQVEMKFSVGAGTNAITTISDLMDQIKILLQKTDPTVDVLLSANGKISIFGNESSVNLTVKNTTRPTSNNYVSNLFLWSGFANGECTGIANRPAKETDLLANIFDIKGEKLGIEMNDVFRVTGSVDSTEIADDRTSDYDGNGVPDGGMMFDTSGTQTMSDLITYIRSRIPAAVEITLGQNDKAGSIIISKDPLANYMLFGLTVSATNNNNDKVTTTAFKNNMLFTAEE